ncbi:universal stress protein [Halococcoides cellulosivorans]|uniref:Stress response protein n=1 Tax=Halococcoides cellulosivorans TaxID=1679096 RepID=A0A2R4WYP8_9EURY|nr:universal stress protein [Halococcoides cellulosivorans]AWB26658.1 stress response protein [Halococcoides cellulosivorans]
MYDRILVPTDGSAEMETVIDHAVNLAQDHGATLHAVYIVDTATMGRMPVDSSWDSLAEMLREDGERALATVEDRAGDVPVERELREGAPSRAIVEYAEACDADVIVMGTHGRGGIDRLLLGSVAERVVRTATVPVLVVPVRTAVDETTERD